MGNTEVSHYCLLRCDVAQSVVESHFLAVKNVSAFRWWTARPSVYLIACHHSLVLIRRTMKHICALQHRRSWLI